MQRTAWAILITLLSLNTMGQERTVGLTQCPDGAFEGYTLFSPHGDTKVYLIDNDGNLVHQWVSSYLPGNTVYLMEDGTLYRAGRTTNSPIVAGGGGGIIERFDWDGNLIWSFTYSNDTVRHHHDFQVLPNGNVILLAWGLKEADEILAKGRDTATLATNTLWPDHLVEVRPTLPEGGEIVWKWDSWDHVIQDRDSSLANYGIISANPGKIDINYYIGQKADWHHSNAIDYNAELDQIIISVINFNELWIIDHNTTTEEAKGVKGDLLYRWGNPAAYKSGGDSDQRFYNMHSVHWIKPGLPDAGQIMAFVNGQQREPEYSSVVKINPGNYELDMEGKYLPVDFAWEYRAEDPASFYSSFMSGSQQLPNGNILIDAGAYGTFFEINEANETVWEYVNPVSARGILSQGESIYPSDAGRADNFVFRATKYAADFEAFSRRSLESMGPIEQATWELDCDEIVLGIDIETEISIYPNPATNHIFIDGLDQGVFQLYDLTGRMILEQYFEEGIISLEDVPPNRYLAKISSGEPFLLIVKK